MFTLADVTASAMHLVGQGASDRYPAPRLLAHANNGVLRLGEAKPELFAVNVWAPTVANSVEQSYATRKILNVTAVRSGTDERGLLPLDVVSLSAWDPTWRSTTAGVPRQGVVIDRDRYVLYPPPSAGVAALLRHVNIKDTYAGIDPINLPSSFLPPLADYVVGMAEMADEEHVNSNRAAGLLQAFFAAVGVTRPAPAGGGNGKPQ